MTQILPAPIRFAFVVLGLINIAVTSVHYYCVPIWSGNCSATALTFDPHNTYLNLACAEIRGVDKPAATIDLAIIAAFSAHTLPPSFWCSVSRAGEATCSLPVDKSKPEQAEKQNEAKS